MAQGASSRDAESEHSIPHLLRPNSLQTGRQMSFGLSERKLGTFEAYMTSCETMWGVIIFLKFGLLVSEGGLLLTLGVLAFAVLVQVMNSLCVSAVATNGLHSGTYSLLVANFGPAWGATTGLLYYMGMTSLATVEICGAVEAFDLLMRAVAGESYLTGSQYTDTAILGSMGLILLGWLRGMNSHTVHVIGMVVLVAFFVTVLACTIGTLTTASFSQLQSNMYPPDGWATIVGPTPSKMLTFIYPCFAGIFQGANKAAELRDPYESIPKAALGSVCTTAVIFTCIFCAVGASEPLSKIDEDDLLLMAWPSSVIALVGTVIVGIGSSISCLDVAPTVLRDIAKDGSVPGLQYLGAHRLTGHHQEPQFATALTVALALPFAWFEGIEPIALAAAICFLQMYFTMDLLCFLNATLHAPGWRPHWKIYSGVQALFAAVLCVATLLGLDYHLAPWIVLVSVFIALIITAHNGSDELGMSDKGETIAGMQFSLAMATLHTLNDDPLQASGATARRSIFWRPQILCYVWPAAEEDAGWFGGQGKRAHGVLEAAHEEDKSAKAVLNLAHYLKEGKGLCVVATVVPPGNAKPAECRERVRDAKLRLRRLATEENLAHFTDATCAQPFDVALRVMLSCTGIGAIRPNTVLLGYDALKPYDAQKARAAQLFDAIKTSLDCDKAILLYLGGEAIEPDAISSGGTTIDVWWFDTVANSVLPLMLCHLLCRHSDFGKVKVRIFSPYWRGNEVQSEVTTFPQAVDRMSRLSSSGLSKRLSTSDDGVDDLEASSSIFEPGRIKLVQSASDADEEDLSLEEHREHMRNFLEMSRIAVDDVTLVACDEKLNVHDAMIEAVRAQAHEGQMRTALIIADLPSDTARTDSARRFAQSLGKLAAGLPPMLLVQSSDSSRSHSHHAAFSASVGGEKIPGCCPSATDSASGSVPSSKKAAGGAAALI
mmetsp:Transcript_24117/g.61639  ORF Transcript_24117/g.61639 Transcript_24117/m.61639 type:complete len:943 (+) Transcript_24117:58-2886(+)